MKHLKQIYHPVENHMPTFPVAPVLGGDVRGLFSSVRYTETSVGRRPVQVRWVSLTLIDGLQS